MYLVTGARGFVGGHLVRHLLANNLPVRAMVRKDSDGVELAKLDAEIVVADLNDRASLEKAVAGMQGIFHIAALFREAKLGESEFFKVNVEGTRNLLNAACAAGVPRFIHCSTNGVHGDVVNPPLTEDAPYNPADYYQRSKVEGEKVVFEFFKSGKISGSILRPGMIWGPGDTRLFKIFKMVAQKKFFYVGPGNALVHFIDVRDLAESFRLAMLTPSADGEAYLIAGREYSRLNVVVDMIAQECGVPKPWLYLPTLPLQLLGDLCELICRPLGIEPPIHRRRVDFYVKNRCFSTSKAREKLGFSGSKNLAEEVREITRWYKTNNWL